VRACVCVCVRARACVNYDNICYYSCYLPFCYSVYTPFHEESPDTSTKAWNAIANSLILMAVIVVMTVLLIVLYKYHCYKVFLSVKNVEVQMCRVYEK
jgi:cytochrome bd-type quinol oxidase subunit 2